MGWPWQSTTKAHERRLGISCGGQRYAAVCWQEGVDPLFFPVSAEEDASAAALLAWLQQSRLETLDINWLAEADDYDLQLVEAPDVSDQELAAAVRFGLGDLARQPLEALVVDAFRLPADAYRGRSSVAMAVMARRDRVKACVDWCRQHQLNLSQILIPELALLNLLRLVEPETSIGILMLQEHQGRLNLYHNDALYLSRHLPIGRRDLGDTVVTVTEPGLRLIADADNAIERLLLELQRSLDYYDSQVGMGQVGQLWLLPVAGLDVTSLVEQLEDVMKVPWRVLRIPGVELPGETIPALAAALQEAPVEHSDGGWL